MTLTIITGTKGRGAWNKNGVGGTLSSTGDAPGRYYCAPATGSGLDMPGLAGARAVRNGTEVSIDEYAVYAAVRAIQTRCGIVVDGIFGQDTAAAVKGFQRSAKVTDDGVVGPATSKAMWASLATAEAIKVDPDPNLSQMLSGHIGWESGWDVGAVGGSTPQDLGLGQINGPSHPDLDADERLSPYTALPWMASFVDSNLTAMGRNTRDGIAAYNLGVGGAKSWVSVGRPAVWTRTVKGKTITTEVKKYIDNVWASR